MDPEPRQPYPLYNTTFTLHRLSPLYIGSDAALNNANLQQYARSFRDILVGEVLRGVRVGLGSDEETLARVGALQSVMWRILPNEDVWDTEEDIGEETTLMALASRGILINIDYEKASYSAILLRGGRQTDEDFGKEARTGEFEDFPLLLTRMPGALRDSLTAFLASTFDTRVSILHLKKSYMITALEQYILDCSVQEGEEASEVEQSNRALRTFIKDIQIVIGFDSSSGLKTIDILINKEDLPRLLRFGKSDSSKDASHSPFMVAITNYVNAHLALDLGHELVKILKIACGAFVLGSEGKIKITEFTDGDDSIQGQAILNLINSLVDLARGRNIGKGNHG